MSYLYTFHIHIFFLLPFLYGWKNISINQITTYIVRFYWPYVLLLLLLSLAYGAINDFEKYSLNTFIYAAIFCDADNIRCVSGTSFLWFLPAFMMTLVLRDFYYRSSRGIRCILIVLSLSANLYYVLSLIIPTSCKLPVFLLPLGLFSAIRYLFLGVLLRQIIYWFLFVPRIWLIICSICLFFIGTHVYFSYVSHYVNKDVVIFRILAIYMPLPATLLMQYSSEHFQGIVKRLFFLLGKESLIVYLVSPFLGYAAYYFIRYCNMESWQMGLLAQIVIISFSYFIAKQLITKTMRSILFPRTWHELKLVSTRANKQTLS